MGDPTDRIIGLRVPRDRRRWQTNFGRLVAEMGPTEFARELRGIGLHVTRTAVVHWVAGRRLPDLRVAEAIFQRYPEQLRPGDLTAHENACRTASKEEW
jgi:hypothetical protein